MIEVPNVGQEIRQRRERKKIAYTEAKIRFGISTTFLWEIENKGKVPKDKNVVMKLENELGFKPGELESCFESVELERSNMAELPLDVKQILRRRGEKAIWILRKLEETNSWDTVEGEFNRRRLTSTGKNQRAPSIKKRSNQWQNSEDPLVRQ